jgi:probable biosynthetic protein (TIGR04099 family)
MTDALLQTEPQRRLDAVSAAPGNASVSAITRAVRIGMPHLALGGLSENWLLKECGHQHWTLLASRLGLATTDFRDASGNRLYAAFTAVRIGHAHLENVKEGDELRLRTSLTRVSRTQWLSNHAAICNGQVVAGVTMGSVFLRRNIIGSNRHVERASLPAATAWTIGALDGSDLLENVRSLRSENWRRHAGFDRASGGELATFTLRPCPYNDFNGADFLYFASFQSIVDRAEWQWTQKMWSPLATKHREIFYYGNIDVGDSLRIVLRAKRPNTDGFSDRKVSHWCQIYRAGDERLIADVFTNKASQPRL